MDEIKGIARAVIRSGKLEAYKALCEEAMEIVRTKDTGTLQYEIFFNDDESEAIVYERYREFGRVLAQAGLQIRALALTPRRTWQIELVNGPRLVLDRVQSERKLERFVRVVGQGFGRLGTGARVVDLRYTNGFAVEWQRGVAAGHPETTQRTKSAARMGAAQEEG